MPTSGPPEPTAISAERAERRLIVDWVDGARSVITFEALRWACPCAVCQGEGGQPGVLRTTAALLPEQTDMTDLRAVGLYAVSPLWADGHDTGIYPYQLLRELGDHAARLG